jgi:hypothetical protein
MWSFLGGYLPKEVCVEQKLYLGTFKHLHGELKAEYHKYQTPQLD